MVRKRQLEILLEKVEGFAEPSARREQYATPATVAASVLHWAYMQGDLEGLVCDLGSGTGVLAIGAKLLGADRVVGLDVDPRAVKTAEENARRVGVSVDWVVGDVNHLPFKPVFNVVVMNPPFGAQRRGADRPFLRGALGIADVIYSIHNYGSKDFVQRFISPSVITEWRTVEFPIRHTFEFHRRERHVIKAEMYRIERR